MFDQGILSKIISERLGHSSIKVTLDLCTYPWDDTQAAAVARFEELIAPRSQNKEIPSFVSITLAKEESPG